MNAYPAYTLVELLVVLGIIALLLAVVLPAVQYAREAARRTQCKSNLRQLGVALHNYESTYKLFPPCTVFDGLLGTPDAQYSTLARILPMLEQNELYNRLNFHVASDTVLAGILTNHPNQTAAGFVVETFLCPSDPHVPHLASGSTNYRVNVDRGPLWKDGVIWADADHGAFFRARIFSARDFSDGLANTAFMTERTRGDGNNRSFSRQGDYLAVDPRAIASLRPETPFFRACEVTEQLGTNGHFSEHGWTWLLSGLEHTAYNHAATPNDPIPDCGVAPTQRGSSRWIGAVSARSQHHKGVHVLTGDAAVRWVSNSVDSIVWQALATRDGGESVPIQF